MRIGIDGIGTPERCNLLRIYLIHQQTGPRQGTVEALQLPVLKQKVFMRLGSVNPINHSRILNRSQTHSSAVSSTVSSTQPNSIFDKGLWWAGEAPAGEPL